MAKTDMLRTTQTALPLLLGEVEKGECSFFRDPPDSPLLHPPLCGGVYGWSVKRFWDGRGLGEALPSLPRGVCGPSSDRWFNLPVDRLSYSAASAVHVG
ncbi:hypothetical protein ACOMHN_058007 [Nucella lapillus]